MGILLLLLLLLLLLGRTWEFAKPHSTNPRKVRDEPVPSPLLTEAVVRNQRQRPTSFQQRRI